MSGKTDTRGLRRRDESALTEASELGVHRGTARVSVRDLMSSDVFTLSPMHSLPLAEALMGLHRIRHIPVVDDEHRVVGLVTHRDLLSAKISGLAPLTDDERSTIQLRVPVSKIMRTDVVTIGADISAVVAARRMRLHKFGCFPVTEGGKLVGILTEADLLALVADPGPPPAPATWPIAHLMTGPPVTITPDTTLADARGLLDRFGIHHLPVIENGAPVGMVADRDLRIAEAVFGSSTEARAAHVAQLLGNTRFHRVSPTAPLAEVVAMMARERIDAVLVVEADVLAGIFTLADGYRIFAELLGVQGEVRVET